MSLRNYTLNKVLARLSAQDREEALARQQGQRDAQNISTVANTIPALINGGLKLSDSLADAQDKTDKEFMDEALANADVYKSKDILAKMASDTESEAGYKGIPNGQTPEPKLSNVPFNKPFDWNDTSALPKTSTAGDKIGKFAVIDPTPVTPSTTDIDIGADIPPPPDSGSEIGHIEATSPIPKDFKDPSAAYNQAVKAAGELERYAPALSRQLRSAADALAANPKDPAALSAVQAAMAKANALPSENIKNNFEKLPAPAPLTPPKEIEVPKPQPIQPAPTDAAVTPTSAQIQDQAQRDRDRTELSRKEAGSYTQGGQEAVRKFASELDSNLAKVVSNPILGVDSSAAAKEIVSKIVAGAQTDPNSLAGILSRFMGKAPSDRAIRMATLIAEKRINDRQISARKVALDEAITRTKLDEQRGGPAGSRGAAMKLYGENYSKFRDIEMDATLNGLAGRIGPQLMQIAQIKDPSARAAEVDKLITVDSLPKGLQLITRDEIAGQLLQNMNKTSNPFSSTGKPKDAPLISDSTLKQLAESRSILDSLNKATPSETAGLNKALSIAGIDRAKFAAELTKSPEAAAADARIRRNVASYLRSTTGLASTDAEYARIWNSAPNESDAGGAYYAKLNDFINEVARYHDTILDTQTQSGRNPGQLSALGPQPQYDINTGTRNWTAVQNEVDGIKARLGGGQ